MTLSDRSCGSCTACCEGWLAIKTDTINTYPGVACPHVISGQGCSIYYSRTEKICASFYCSWVEQQETFPEWMQPSLSKAIVMHQRLPWQDKMLDLAVPVGTSIPLKTLQWLEDYSRSNDRPFIYAELEAIDGVLTGSRQIKIFAAQPLRDNILAWLEAGNKFW